MDAIASDRGVALEVARTLEEHLAEDTVVLFVGEVSSIADYFVITTVRSSTHLRSLMNHLREILDLAGKSPRERGKDYGDSGWVLLDCGGLVVHLMSKDMREFYELERLWFNAEVLTQRAP